MAYPLERVRPAGFNDDDFLEDGDLDSFDERILTLATVLRHQGLEQWQASAVLADLSAGALATGPGAYREGASYVGRVVCGWRLAGQGSPSRRALVAFGRRDSGSTPAWALSLGGSHWVSSLLGEPHVDYANGDSGVLVTSSLGSRNVMRLEFPDGSWQTINAVVAAGHGVIALHYIESDDRLIASDSGGSNTDKILTSDDHGATWDHRAFVSNYTPRAFADDGAGNVACVAWAPAGPTQSPKLAISHDAGETWAPVLNTALPGDQNLLNDSLSPALDVAVTYVPDTGALVVVAGSAIYRSIDGGASWERRSSTDLSTVTSPFSIGPTGDGPVPHQFAAAAGPCLACSVNWPMTSAGGGQSASWKRPGVIYSFDLGDTWKLVDLGPPLPITKRVTQIKPWNGRFVVGSFGVVYTSGLVANSPPVDFSADG